MVPFETDLTDARVRESTRRGFWRNETVAASRNAVGTRVVLRQPPESGLLVANEESPNQQDHDADAYRSIADIEY